MSPLDKSGMQNVTNSRPLMRRFLVEMAEKTQRCRKVCTEHVFIANSMLFKAFDETALREHFILMLLANAFP